MAIVKYNKDIYDTLKCIKGAEEDPQYIKRVLVQNKKEKIERLVEKSTKEHLMDTLNLKGTIINDRLSYLVDNNLIHRKDMYMAVRAMKIIYRLTPLGKAWLKSNEGFY